MDITDMMKNAGIMTVGELIELLQKVPKDYQVSIQSPENFNMSYPVTKLIVDTIDDELGFVVIGIENQCEDSSNLMN